MQPAVAVAHELVTRIQPFDETERAHPAAPISRL
jgi:hypothetical protein